MRFSLAVISLIAVTPPLTASAEEDDEGQCRLWLGPSSLAAKSMKYGLFAGVDFKVGDIIPSVELGIPFVDFFVESNKNSEYNKGMLDYLENQMWTADFAASKFEGNVSTSPYFPGVGALGNYHALVSNVDWQLASTLLREREDITEPGVPHLSRGAITSIYNVTMKATQPIPAGMELFPNFGDMWDKDEATPFQDKIDRKDFAEADQVLDRIIDFYDRFEAEMSDKLKEDMLDFMLDKILGSAGGKRAATIKSLIPENYKKLKAVKEAGGTYLYRNKNVLKKEKWLKKNAVCVDVMYPAKSTIPEAGYGAFASKDIAAGETISVIPTVLFGKKKLMNMYDIVVTPDEQGKPTNVYDKTRPRGQQIAINYAYGHPESSFLFLPMSPLVNFINHKSEANAKLQWSQHDTMYHDQATWDHTVEEVQNFKSNMVVFQIEATEDIKKGDEIFIDYGDEWVEAWSEYESMWESNYKGKPWPLKAEDVKVAFKDKPYPLTRESSSGVIPTGVETACYVKTKEVPDGAPSMTEDGTEKYVWNGPNEYKEYSAAYLTACELLEKSDDGEGSYVYTVLTKTVSKGKMYVAKVSGVPHVAVTVVDAPYAGDIHMKDAFRHPIVIPDDIFPQAWRDQR